MGEYPHENRFDEDVKRVHPDLPIFLVNASAYGVFYTPGQLAVADWANVPATLRALNDTDRIDATGVPGELSHWLREQAHLVLEKRDSWVNAAFEPECLTVYLSNNCNMSCRYCYAWEQGSGPMKSPRKNLQVIADETVARAAVRVAGNCAAKGKPFSLVLHGGGEPTFHWSQVKRFVKITKSIAAEFKIDWFGYIATNGVLTEDRVRWLARHFDRIGLSCDGPPDIQDIQRPLENGGKSSPFIERTACILNDSGSCFEVRATITPHAMTRQVDIVGYLFERLGARKIRFEPAYRLNEKNYPPFEPGHAEAFVTHFLAARQKARSVGCDLSFSGVRLNEIHGPYCDVLKETLHLTPDGNAATCFFCTETASPDGIHYKAGWPGNGEESFVLDANRIRQHRSAATCIPESCRNCINSFHCARGCPDICFRDDWGWCISGDSPYPFQASALFRCRIQKRLAVSYILEAAGNTARGNAPQREIVYSNPLTGTGNRLPPVRDEKGFSSAFKELSKRYDLKNRRMPAPIWAKRGFEYTGQEAWNHLKWSISRQDAQLPFSIYLHIPFCLQKCVFCDCHAFPLGRNKTNKDERYVEAMLAEIKAFSFVDPLSHRPVTTIHFGGGTPNAIRPILLKSIVDELRSHFNILPETEWAIESTGELIDGHHLNQLKNLGFRRLHVGVQTLAEPLRQRIGRRITSRNILHHLDLAIEKEFITSVDILYGLPGQTIKDLTETLNTLFIAGIHGISLYRLNISRRNQILFKRFNGFQADACSDFSLYEAADQLLISKDYKKNHFTHYAKSPDRNLYFTHTTRGEDLLAIGATADGLFGTYHYRHPGYTAYIKWIDSSFPFLEGGLYESALETLLQPAISELMGGKLSPMTFEKIQAESLLADWIEFALVKEEGKDYFLTASGSWFIDDMISELYPFTGSMQETLTNPTKPGFSSLK